MPKYPFPSSLGTLRTIVGDNPAANTEWSVTVPPDRSYLLLGASVSLAQGITQTPQPALIVDDGTNVLGQYLGASAAQNASVTSQYSWGRDLPLSAGAAATVNTAPFPPALVLRGGYRIRSLTTGIGANTDYGPPTLFVCDLGQWSPTALNGLVAWFDFGDPTTLFSDTGRTTLAVPNGTVAGVTDKSGNGNHLSQATGAQQPLYIPNAINGRSIVRFADANDNLAAAAITHNTNYLTAFVVVNPTTLAANGYSLNLAGDKFFFNVTTAIVDAGSQGDVGYSIWERATPLTAGTWYVLSATVDRSLATGEAQGWWTGTHTGSQTLNVNNTTTISSTSAGWSIGTTTIALLSDVSQVLWFNTLLTQAQHNTIGRSLAARVGATWVAV